MLISVLQGDGGKEAKEYAQEAVEKWRELGMAKESGRADLNRRPQRPERCALTGLRYAPSTFILYTRCQLRTNEACLKFSQLRDFKRSLAYW